MAKIKGCVKAGCVSCKKKEHYKKDDMFCTKCGQELVFVCKKCHTPIDEDTKGNLCARCQAEKDDSADKLKDTGKKVGAGVLGVGALALSAAKVVVDVVKKV